MSAPDAVLRLIHKFDQNKGEYLAPHYNETQVRQEFIDPFFTALGWDVTNKRGLSANHKDVILEDEVKVERLAKAPDYGFYIDGRRKFFVEAKKPSVALSGKPGMRSAFQLRRYAWNAGLTVSILTNFIEFSVYDGRVKPDAQDPVTTARIAHFSYDKYDEDWDKITDWFAREAVAQGRIDRYAEQKTTLRNVIPVDDAFLAEIEGWRELLAANIVKMNHNKKDELTPRALNYAVQMTIDRLVFLRICEDRGIEPPGLFGTVNGGNTYARLMHVFRQADVRYNSGLFHFGKEAGRDDQPDAFTPVLHIDDEPLQQILRKLYDENSVYDFSQIPVEVLGNVYERFLGKVITLDPNPANGAPGSGGVTVVEKPEVRKAGGVYYTPTYIVDHIVRHTVGVLLEGKTPTEAAKLHIVDPACGSGSFLLGAYQFLLDWYRDWYASNDPAAHPADVFYHNKDAMWRLTTARRRQILLDNLFGVDIDAQAVEVTKLSLLLRLLEGESERSVTYQLTVFKQRALPDLNTNVKCGNSLIGYDAPEGITDNPFDWKSEFPTVFKNGGFDAVIGNPPYGIVFDENSKAYLENNYPTFGRNNDMYVVFCERAIKLLRPKGHLGFIIPNTFLIGPYFDQIKTYILKTSMIHEIIDFGLIQVFKKPNVFTCIMILQREDDIGLSREHTIRLAHISDKITFPSLIPYQQVQQKTFETLIWSPQTDFIKGLLNQKPSLDDIALVKDVGLNYWTEGRGKKRGDSIAKRILYDGTAEHPEDIAYLKGRDIARYNISIGDHWLRHDYSTYLDSAVDTFRFSADLLNKEKIIYRQTADRLIATIDKSRSIVDKTLHVVILKPAETQMSLQYVLGLLNSKLLNFIYMSIAQETGRTFAQVKIFRVKQLPIHAIDFINKKEKAQHDQIVTLVERMLQLHTQRAATFAPPDQKALDRQIAATDQQIDQIVYALYSLSVAEIALVEGA